MPAIRQTAETVFQDSDTSPHERPEQEAVGHHGVGQAERHALLHHAVVAEALEGGPHVVEAEHRDHRREPVPRARHVLGLVRGDEIGPDDLDAAATRISEPTAAHQVAQASVGRNTFAVKNR